MEKRLIPINITKAHVEAISLDFLDAKNQVKYSATVALLQPNGERVTSIYVGNSDWDTEKRAECSITAIALSCQLRAEIEVLVTQHMNKMQKILDVK